MALTRRFLLNQRPAPVISPCLHRPAFAPAETYDEFLSSWPSEESEKHLALISYMKPTYPTQAILDIFGQSVEEYGEYTWAVRLDQEDRKVWVRYDRVGWIEGGDGVAYIHRRCRWMSFLEYAFNYPRAQLNATFQMIGCHYHVYRTRRQRALCNVRWIRGGLGGVEDDVRGFCRSTYLMPYLTLRDEVHVGLYCDEKNALLPWEGNCN